MFFIILTFLAALFIEGLGSLVSVIGISALFGANPIIIALAIALDVGKIVVVSLLYTYWKALSKLMKAYALVAAAVTMTITSAGAAGYLSGEFQKSMLGTKEGELKVAVLKDQQAKYQARKAQIDDQIANLPAKTSVNQRLRLMNGFKAEQKALDAKIDEIDKKLPELQVAQIGTEAKAGPIVSISKAFDIPVEEAVTWVIGMIIFVFDPLAVFLIIAGNFLWARHKKEKAIPEASTKPVDIQETRYEQNYQKSPPLSMPYGEKFPATAIAGAIFYRTDLATIFLYDGKAWQQVSRSRPVEPPPVPPPTYVTETVYETYQPEPIPEPEAPPPEPVIEPEPEPEPIEVPEEVLPPEPEPEIIQPEPVKVPNETTLAAMEEANEILEAHNRRSFVATGLLKPVFVTAPEDENDLDHRRNFIPLKVEPQEDVAVEEEPQEVAPEPENVVPIHRDEITRSSLGLVPADPHTIVDARNQGSYRRPTIQTTPKR